MRAGSRFLHVWVNPATMSSNDHSSLGSNAAAIDLIWCRDRGNRGDIAFDNRHARRP